MNLMFSSLIEFKYSKEEVKNDFFFLNFNFFFCIINIQLINGGVIDYWIELAQKQVDPDLMANNTVNNRLAGINILVECWKHYPEYVENSLGIVNNIMALLKRGTRDLS